MNNINFVDEGRELLRELQTLLFQEDIGNEILFTKTLEIDDILNKASINYNKYLNDLEIQNKK